MSWSHLGWGAMLEIAVGIVLLALAVWLYRRPAPNGNGADAAANGGSAGQRQYGSQGAVILIIIAAILLVHGFGALEYRPSAAELDAMQGRG